MQLVLKDFEVQTLSAPRLSRSWWLRMALILIYDEDSSVIEAYLNPACVDETFKPSTKNIKLQISASVGLLGN